MAENNLHKHCRANDKVFIIKKQQQCSINKNRIRTRTNNEQFFSERYTFLGRGRNMTVQTATIEEHLATIRNKDHIIAMLKRKLHQDVIIVKCKKLLFDKKITYAAASRKTGIHELRLWRTLNRNNKMRYDDAMKLTKLWEA